MVLREEEEREALSPVALPEPHWLGVSIIATFLRKCN